jgi:hypothetical protein
MAGYQGGWHDISQCRNRNDAGAERFEKQAELFLSHATEPNSKGVPEEVNVFVSGESS